MAHKSAIEWTEATWNPWHGCHKVSPGRLLDGREWNEMPGEIRGGADRSSDVAEAAA